MKKKIARILLISWFALFALPEPIFAAQLNYHYVGGIGPPNDWLSLRTEPSDLRGQRIMEMPNETVLEVLDKMGGDGWWRVRVTSNDQIGWARSGDGKSVWIHSCGTNTVEQDNWVEFYFDGRTHFYYAPNSVVRCRGIVSVKWHNGDVSTGTLSIFAAELDCKGDTWRLLYVDKFDPSSNDPVGTIDVRGENARRGIKNTIGQPLSQRVCPILAETKN